jgi:hypothetical protein
MEDDLCGIRQLAWAIYYLAEHAEHPDLTEPIMRVCLAIQDKCDVLEEQRRKAAGQVQSCARI